LWSNKKSFFLSRKEEKAQREVIKPLRLCVFARVFFLGSQREKALTVSRLRASTFFFSRKVEKAQREVIQPLRLCAFAREFFFFSKLQIPVRHGG
jgi:hypothetical protein